jgi:hypothetical protein
MQITKILKDLLSEREAIDEAIEALDLLRASAGRRGPGRPPKPLQIAGGRGRRSAAARAKMAVAQRRRRAKERRKS